MTDRNTQITEKKVVAVPVDELILPVSHAGRQKNKQTHRLSKEIVLTQCSIVQIIGRDLGLKCLVFLPPRLLDIIVSFSYTRVSQGSV